MDLKIFFALLILFALPAFASNQPDLCPRISGSWYGQFVLKNPEDCHLYHGCRQNVSAQVKSLDSTNFQVIVKPQIGGEKTFTIQCVNSQVTSLDNPGRIELSRLDRSMYSVKYDGVRLSASLLSVGEG